MYNTMAKKWKRAYLHSAAELYLQVSSEVPFGHCEHRGQFSALKPGGGLVDGTQHNN